ncbi:SH3 domain-containing protein (plasmid) [Streptomyces sp. NBC_01310]|uniref:SH3 domain-containing protein n=1 Tax=Streptomyces sp. NBC_01310 TaxID=2903820 RepID=UPI0035B60166|nr:SH3 domain-containing protein [Streptomyces sp. NBC_01310]
MKLLLRRTATAATVGTLLLGGVLVAATSASAAGSSTCNIDDAKPGSVWETSTSNVNLRSGPGTGYSSKGQLRSGTDFTYHCSYLTSDGKNLWYYGTVREGYHKGVSGWVSWRYAHLA